MPRFPRSTHSDRCSAGDAEDKTTERVFVNYIFAHDESGIYYGQDLRDRGQSPSPARTGFTRGLNRVQEWSGRG
jgi:hypothetical protein